MIWLFWVIFITLGVSFVLNLITSFACNSRSEHYLVTRERRWFGFLALWAGLTILVIGWLADFWMIRDIFLFSTPNTPEIRTEQALLSRFGFSLQTAMALILSTAAFLSLMVCIWLARLVYLSLESFLALPRQERSSMTVRLISQALGLICSVLIAWKAVTLNTEYLLIRTAQGLWETKFNFNPGDMPSVEAMINQNLNTVGVSLLTKLSWTYPAIILLVDLVFEGALWYWKDGFRPSHLHKGGLIDDTSQLGHRHSSLVISRFNDLDGEPIQSHQD